MLFGSGQMRIERVSARQFERRFHDHPLGFVNSFPCESA
jgi:hypothetical protein